MSSACCSSVIVFEVQLKGFSICPIRPENLFSSCSQNIQMLFGKIQVGRHMHFTRRFPFNHSTKKAWLMEWCCDGHPSSRLSNLCRGFLKLWQSDCLAVGHLPDHGTSCPVTCFGLTANSRKSPGGSNLLHFTVIEARLLLGTLKVLEMVLQPFVDLCLTKIFISAVYRELLGLCCLVFVLTCCVNCFLNDIQSVQFAKDGLLSSSTDISRIIKANRKHLTTSRMGDRVFSYQVPLLWNHLPVWDREVDTFSTFKSRLKTFLFDKVHS